MIQPTETISLAFQNINNKTKKIWTTPYYVLINIILSCFTYRSCIYKDVHLG